LGDYKYYGLGSDSDLQEAAEHYKIAAQTHQNAQAMYLFKFNNLTIGTPKDQFFQSQIELILY